MADAIPPILFADDNPTEGMLLRMALADQRVSIEVVQVFNGVEAWDALQDAAQRRPYPYSLIMTDLSMPRLSGLELLKRLQGHPALAGIPTVLTSSPSPRDRAAAMGYSPSLYLIKPDDYRGLCVMVAQLLPLLRRG
jgi:CheY-like chemotaxis protein